MMYFCRIYTIATLIQAQTSPALDDAGTCHDQLTCAGAGEPNLNYGECCGDPARISFLRNMPFNCFDCPPGSYAEFLYSL